MNAQKGYNINNPKEEYSKNFKIIRKRTFIRLLITYLSPLIILIFFFHYAYNKIIIQDKLSHLRSIAEHQANMLDLFLRERVVNLINLIDEPNFKFPPSNEFLNACLQKLKKDSEAFIDIGFFDESGVQKGYVGPITSLELKDYSTEKWFINLLKSEKRYIVTDIYLGLRNEPHFTIAVKRNVGNKIYIIKAALDPQKIYDYMLSIEYSKDIYISIINKEGNYQLVHPEIGKLFEKSPVIPSFDSAIGSSEIKENGKVIYYGYTVLKQTNWMVIVMNYKSNGFWTEIQLNILIVAFIIIGILIIIIYFRSKKMAEMWLQKEQAVEEKEVVKSQLEHASKLASVGELAAGIAHEINNPLAIIASEVGLIKDYLDPQFNINPSFSDLIPHLDNIHEAAFRARDITRKLLTFVRHEEFKLEKHNINKLIDNLIEGFYERELAVSNIEIIRQYDNNLPEIITDANLFKQVILNIINNAVDAITPPGKITIKTEYKDNNVIVSISDTGKGISEEQMEKIFMPFYTTKEVGKGTGLGLSVSYGIVKNLGGNIEVESVVGKGSTFRIILPNIESS